MVNVKGFSPRYAAPEVFAHSRLEHVGINLVQEQRSDIYAFGVVMWEIIERSKPWEGYSFDDIELHVRQGKRPSPIPTTDDDRIKVLIELLQLCWREDLNSRPRAINVVQKLELL